MSCGKEGILAKFLTFVSTEQRDLVGIIPSISNIVNTCSKIFDFGLAGQDDDMLAMQDELNAFREKIYDSAVNKGKAQRGTKISFAHLYKEILVGDSNNSLTPNCIEKSNLKRYNQSVIKPINWWNQGI